MEHYSPPRELSSSFLRKKVHHLEEKLLELSGLKLYEELHIFDVPIDYQGYNFIHTTRCGDQNKENLVLLHGYGGSSVLYYPMLKDLSKQYRVFCIDMLGLGLSSRPEFKAQTTEESIDFYVESLEKWRKEVGLEEFYLGGHSFGGYMAGHYTAKYQSRVKKLFLLSPVGVTKFVDDTTVEQFMATLPFFRRQIFKLFMKFWNDKLTPTKVMTKYPWVFAWGLRKYVNNRFKLSEAVANILYEYLTETFKLPESGEVSVHYILKPPRARAKVPLEDVIIESIDVPIVCYYGDHDWMDASGATRIYSSNRKPNFSLKIIANSGHQITMENPVGMSEALLLEISS